MSLRLRLFLLFGGLVALLVAAQWWWVRALTRDLTQEMDEVAFSVGRSMVAVFKDLDAVLGETEAGGAGAHGVHDVEIAQMEGGGEQAGKGATAAPGEVFVRKVRRTVPSEGAARAEHGARHAYAFEVEDRVTTGGEDEDERIEKIEKHLKIHVEHEGGGHYLWVGAPSAAHRIQIPQRGLRDKLERFSRRSVLGSLGLLAVGLAIAAAVAHRVTSPLRRLADAARRVGDGALGTRVPEAADGEVGEAIAAFNCMSGRLEELDARSRELEASRHLGEIGEIARGLAHTLRNPLNALGLSVEELAAGAGGTAESGTAESAAAAPELADSARRQIRRIDHGIRSFLALASQSGGVVDDVDVGELLADVGLEALQDARGRVRLDLEVGDDLPRLAAARPELRAVLQALVVNAVEASPEGGRVTVRAAELEGGRLRIEVEDQGPGLAPEVRRRLFTPHLSTKANGSGMGLFLAHRIATNRYGGRLELIDPEGERGTRAVLDLGPRAAAGEEGEHA